MRSRALWALLAGAAAARILLAIAAMPPYAGLDEAWHVARVSFVAREHRQPTVFERSIPPYIGESIRGGRMPAFGELRERWAERVLEPPGGGLRPAIDERPFTAHDFIPYESANYEAQQPPLYYAIASPLAGGSAAGELRRLRLLSGLFALITILAAASIAQRFFGTRGVVAAVLIASLPTWITLVARASNDALACALVAVGIAITASSPRGWRIAAEALVWALAVAAKLYVWPIAIVVPVFWRMQRGSRARLAIVVLACAIAALLTMRDLSARTRNPLGHFGFDAAPTHAAAPKPIDYASIVKITLASFVWTSGQHADALRPAAMVVYVLPLIVLAVSALRRAEARRYTIVAAVAVAVFGIAQLVDLAAFIRQAHGAGQSLPLGGKEGWYWYTLAPLVIGVFAYRARFAAIWLIAWDIVITEGALFHDFAGWSSPSHPSLLFTWGPLHAPFTADLTGIGVGPLASHLLALRLIHLAFAGGLFALESRLHDRNTDFRADPHARPR